MPGRLTAAVLGARRRGERVGVILIDLNGFKGINDRLGHDIGDHVLIEVAARMNATRRPSDLLARLGGDEFAVVLPHLDSVASAAAVAERMLATFAEACMVDGFPVSIDASFGVAVLPDHAGDAESLLRRADETMYSAKVSQQGVTVYEPTVHGAGGVGRIGLLADLTSAVLANELFLEYQPVVALATNELVAVEALVRWRHPALGVLYPGEFMALAEQTDLIGALTEWVLREALTQCAKWMGGGWRLRVAVNVSARNMNDVRFPDVVSRLLSETGVDPQSLDLEITENTVGLDRAAIQSVLNRLHQLGVSLAIDDFGTGYSSMAQLRDLPVDRLKIDRSFVTNMATENKDAQIVRAIVQLAQALHIETVAEGVEDPHVAQMLADLGCTTGQGWLYGKPTSHGEFSPDWTQPALQSQGLQL